MDRARRGRRGTHLCADGRMFFTRALGTALLAVPLAGAAGQSPSHPPPDSTGDHGASHRFMWIAGAGVTSAAVFTTFVRLSGQPSAGSAQLAPVTPGPPVPDQHTDATLPGDGSANGQTPPPSGDSTAPGSGIVVGGSQSPDIIDTPIPPGPQFELPPDTTSSTDGNGSGNPNDGVGDPPHDPPPPQGPETVLAVVVTTPEPETFALLGTGLVALVPLVRRRRTAA